MAHMYTNVQGRCQEWRVKEPAFLTKETWKMTRHRKELGEFKELKKGLQCTKVAVRSENEMIGLGHKGTA